MSHLDRPHILSESDAQLGISSADHHDPISGTGYLPGAPEIGPESTFSLQGLGENINASGNSIGSSDSMQTGATGMEMGQANMRPNGASVGNYLYGQSAHLIPPQGSMNMYGGVKANEAFVGLQPPMHNQYAPSGMGGVVPNASTSMNSGMMQENRPSATGSLSVSLPGDNFSSQYMQIAGRNPSMLNQQLQHQQIPGQPVHSYYMQSQPVGQPGLPVQPMQSSCPLPGQSTAGKAWHSAAEHRAGRDVMTEEIIKLLKSRRPNANDNWHEKLPQMAKRLEEALYREASSLEEYENKGTLKQRLQHLAVVMGGNKTSQLQQQQQRGAGAMQRPAAGPPTTGFPGQPVNYSQVSHQVPAAQPHQYAAMQRPAAGAPAQYAPQQGIVMQGQPGAARQMHPSMGFHHQQGMRMVPVQMPQNPQYVADPAQGYMQNYPQQNMMPMGYAQSSDSEMHHFMTGNMISQRPVNGAEKSALGQPSEEHRKQVLKQQQQRLLLLRHASKCPHDLGRCPVTPHCWNMKQLWKHIMSCKDQECKMPHCVSSRYVLSHYSKCKDGACPVCGPVREAIKRNYLKSQEIIRRHPADPAATAEAAAASASSTGKASKRAKIQEADAAAAATATTIKIPPKPKNVYPLDPISCGLYCFTNEQIQAHFRTIQEGLLLTVAKIKEMCKPVIEELFKVPHVYNIFGMPVDPVQLGIPDYLNVIKFPMDLGTVMKKLDAGSYRDLQTFQQDVHLTFNNALTFNPEKSDVFLLAKNMKKDFDAKFKKRVDEFERMVDANRKDAGHCLICGVGSLKFEPPVYYCNGPCCQKIKRNSTYYCYNNNYHWCSSCYNQVKDQVEITLPDVTFKVSELVKKKHNEDTEDPWVQCDGCSRWVHQLCGLFNNRRNVSDDVAYVCPVCLQEKRKKTPEQDIVAPTTKKMRAADLPKTTLSEFIEKRIVRRLQIEYEEFAEKMGVSVESVEKCPELTLREVACLDKLQIVRDGVHHRYKDKGYPADFPCRTKCLVLFQNIDNQDVLLFGMYVYEYGHRCPQPNQRRVYISYLDSVHYLRPKQFRTLVYHEILISYLDYVKARGFHTAHIWACPPQKGDDYILYVHPPDQKTPKPQTLRVWYDDMLKRCVERGVVVEVTDFHTEFLANPANEATVLPYFEGDYWVNEAEVIIKNLKDGKSLESSESETGKSKRRSKAKRTTQTSVAASSLRVERDPVMAKLANIIEPMKDTFFVARLHSREYIERIASLDLAANERASAEDAQRSEQELQQEALSGQDIVPTVPMQMDDEAGAEDDFARAASAIESNSSGGGGGASSDFAAAEHAALSSSSSSSAVSAVVSTATAMDVAESKEDEEVVSRERSLGEAARSPVDLPMDMVKREREGGSRLIMCGEDMPSLPTDTEDVDDVHDCEHFDTRQQFLNLCQGNHYQFDQLRRAKHSSMMVLYHLHNPDAPKFVHSCRACSSDILSGYRYNCSKCECDFCSACVSATSSIHPHPLRPMAIGDTPPAVLTEEQRREKQRSIQLHMQLLTHASNCVKCSSNNCAKMKDFLLHEKTCKEKKNGCRLCQRVSNLLNIHARNCRSETCRVPQCSFLKSQNRKNALRQQQMDDRRRQQMNSEYGRSSAAEDE